MIQDEPEFQSMSLASIVVWLAGATFILYGFAFAIQPHDMAYLTTGLEPDTVSGLVDIRATYGGTTIAVGIIIIYLKQRVSVQHSLLVVWLVLLCMAITRGMGFILDGQTNSLMYLYFAAEILGAALAMWAVKSERLSRSGTAPGNA
jgi:hypothetical protein